MKTSQRLNRKRKHQPAPLSTSTPQLARRSSEPFERHVSLAPSSTPVFPVASSCPIAREQDPLALHAPQSSPSDAAHCRGGDARHPRRCREAPPRSGARGPPPPGGGGGCRDLPPGSPSPLQ